MRKIRLILSIVLFELLGLTNCNTIDEASSDTAEELPPIPEIDCDQVQTELGDPEQVIDYSQATEICEENPDGIHWLGSVEIHPDSEQPQDLRGMWCFCSIAQNFELGDFDHELSEADYRKKIKGISSLKTLYGLENLRSVGLDFLILGQVKDAEEAIFQSKLQDITNLHNLRKVGRNLLIAGHTHITELDVLSNLENLGGLMIADMANLQSLPTFSLFTKIGGRVDLLYLPKVSSFSGFKSIEEIGWYLRVFNLPKIKNFEGFASLSKIGGDLHVGYYDQSWFFNSNKTSAAFQNFNGLTSLREIGERFSVINLDNMSAISTDGSLGNLASVGMELKMEEFEDNSRLIYFEDNDQLSSVGSLGQALSLFPVLVDGIFVSKCNKELSQGEANEVLQHIDIPAVINNSNCLWVP